MLRKKDRGFGLALVAVALVLVATAGFTIWRLTQSDDEASGSQKTVSTSQSLENDAKMTLLESDFLGSYKISNSTFGTEVTVTVDEQAGVRRIVSNALPNHKTGEFPNSGNPNSISEQSLEREYPLTPVFIGQATDVREPGVAINGVKFEPATAEVATCSSGETYNIEAIQDITDLGLDFNNAHVQPTGEYHYHGASDLLAETNSQGGGLVHVGFAADGHLMYYSSDLKSSYKLGSGSRQGSNCTYQVGGSSQTITFGAKKDGSLTQDWEFDASTGDLDECNGIEIDGQHVYIVTDEFPFISRCLMGEFTETAPGGTPPGGQPVAPGQGPPPMR